MKNKIIENIKALSISLFFWLIIMNIGFWIVWFFITFISLIVMILKFRLKINKFHIILAILIYTLYFSYNMLISLYLIITVATKSYNEIMWLSISSFDHIMIIINTNITPDVQILMSFLLILITILNINIILAYIVIKNYEKLKLSVKKDKSISRFNIIKNWKISIESNIIYFMFTVPVFIIIWYILLIIHWAYYLLIISLIYLMITYIIKKTISYIYK